MSFIFSAALEEAFSQACHSGTARSAPSSGSPMHKPCLWHDKTMAPSRLSRFGITCSPLTGDRGVELLTWWLEVSRVKTFPSPDQARGSTVSEADSGEMARIIGEVRPSYVFVENSPALITRGLGTVLGDLAALGFDARWTVLGASEVDAHHHRERIWILAHANGKQRDGAHAAICARRHATDGGGAHVSDADGDVVQGLVYQSQTGRLRRPIGLHGGARSIHIWPDDPAEAPESGLGRVADWVAHRSHRIKALGNGQVPRVAATAWRMLDVWGVDPNRPREMR